MSDTIRELCIQAITARLAIITVANGYNSNVGAAVQRAKMAPATAPGCNVWPHPETAEAKYGKNICTMQVFIEATDFYGTDNPSVIHEQLLGDLKKALLSQSWFSMLSPNVIDSIRMTAGGTDNYPNEEELAIGTKLLLSVQYTETIGDPYST